MSHRTFKDSTSLEARQGLLDNRCERKTKRHRVLKRAKRRNALKLQKAKHKIAVRLKKKQRYLDAVRAYWSGIVDNHP